MFECLYGAINEINFTDKIYLYETEHSQCSCLVYCILIANFSIYFGNIVCKTNEPPKCYN